MKLTKTKLYLSAISILLLGCAPNTPPEDYSVTTGWATNWQQNGGFEAKLKNSQAKSSTMKVWKPLQTWSLYKAGHLSWAEPKKM